MQKLKQELKRIDHKGYKAYKGIKGKYNFGTFFLSVDYVQSDPFASPSQISIQIPIDNTWVKQEMCTDKTFRIALEDYIIRAFSGALNKVAKQRRGTGNSGLIVIDKGGQEILPRSSCKVTSSWIELRIAMGLPAQGRTVLAGEASAMFFQELPRAVQLSLQDGQHHYHQAWKQLKVAKDASYLRCKLSSMGLIAFVAENSILPRRSGVDPRPMDKGAIPFCPIPDSLKVSVELPYHGDIVGLGIPKGITLIVGGGYHGKSTLLSALANGIYNHIPGDGREFVVSDPNAFTIRAEDGRRIEKVDISPFINKLPYGRSTARFSTQDASGSTSQAANIIEAVELGASALILDEDTSANNFMVRDWRMQLLVAKDKEPIVPFIDRVRQLFCDLGVSTILVLGGSGDYLDVADCIVQMDSYRPVDVTQKARRICIEHPTLRKKEVTDELTYPPQRVPLPSSFDPSKGRREERVKSIATRTILFGVHEIDISCIEQLVDPSQTRFIADVMLFIARELVDGTRNMRQLLSFAFEQYEKKGFDGIMAGRFGDRAYARPLEVGAAINRLRTLRIK